MSYIIDRTKLMAWPAPEGVPYSYLRKFFSLAPGVRRLHRFSIPIAPNIENHKLDLGVNRESVSEIGSYKCDGSKRHASSCYFSCGMIMTMKIVATGQEACHSTGTIHPAESQHSSVPNPTHGTLSKKVDSQTGIPSCHTALIVHSE